MRGIIITLILALTACPAFAFNDLREERRFSREHKDYRHVQGENGKRYAVDGRGTVYENSQGQVSKPDKSVKRKVLSQGSGSAVRSAKEQINHLPPQLYHQKATRRY